MQRRLLYPSLVPRCFSSVPPVRAGAAQCLLPQNSFASRALFCNAFLLVLIQSVIDGMKSVLSMAVPRSPCVSASPRLAALVPRPWSSLGPAGTARSPRRLRHGGDVQARRGEGRCSRRGEGCCAVSPPDAPRVHFVIL